MPCAKWNYFKFANNYAIISIFVGHLAATLTELLHYPLLLIIRNYSFISKAQHLLV